MNDFWLNGKTWNPCRGQTHLFVIKRYNANNVTSFNTEKKKENIFEAEAQMESKWKMIISADSIAIIS